MFHHLDPDGSGPTLPDASLENQASICSEYVAACFGQLGVEIACGHCPYITLGDFVADERVAPV